MRATKTHFNRDYETFETILPDGFIQVHRDSYDAEKYAKALERKNRRNRKRTATIKHARQSNRCTLSRTAKRMRKR